MTNSNQLDFHEPTLQQVADLCSQFGFTCAGEADLACLRAVLREGFSRWGNHSADASKMVGHQPAPPDEGEVGELVAKLRRLAPHNPLGSADPTLNRAADLLQHGQSAIHRLHRLQQENARFREPERTILCDLLANGTLLPDPDGTRYGVPPAEGEVGELVAELSGLADYFAGEGYSSDWIIQLTRAADLLERRHPTPVPVSERLPGAEDCDAEGRCWWFNPGQPAMSNPHIATSSWRLCRMLSGKPMGTNWLPATALPLPAGEVQP